jgi:hypothetical protein
MKAQSIRDYDADPEPSPCSVGAPSDAQLPETRGFATPGHRAWAPRLDDIPRPVGSTDLSDA